MLTSYATLATRVAIVIAVALVASAALYARGLEPGLTFATNGINLKIDSKAWYNGAKVQSATWNLKDLTPGSDKFFNFNDIKPGDFGCNVISMHVQKTDAWMCLDFKNLQENENGENEPESLVDNTPGADLAAGTEFFGWVDDGDGKYEPPSEKALFGTSTQAASQVINDDTYVIGDSKNGGVCKQDTTRYVGMCWCAGNLVVATNGKMTCDAATLGNIAQTDSFTVDVSIRAEPAGQKPKFVCGDPTSGGGHGGGPGGGGGTTTPPTPPAPKPWPFNIPQNVFNLLQGGGLTNSNIQTQLIQVIKPPAPPAPTSTPPTTTAATSSSRNDTRTTRTR